MIIFAFIKGAILKELFNQIDITNSQLYKKNVKIHKNLWKLYGFTLSLIILLLIYINKANIPMV